MPAQVSLARLRISSQWNTITHPGTRPGEAADPTPLALLRGEPVEIGAGTILTARFGKRISVEGSAAPASLNGVLGGVVVNLRDVSTRQWKEEQARIAHKVGAAARLAENVSGAYANLLAVIRGRIAELLDQFPQYGVLRRAGEEIEQAAAAADAITRRLAGLGARHLPNLEIVTLNALLRRNRKLMESIMGDRVTVVLRPDSAGGKIWADGAQIEQVLMNLVIRAGASLAREQDDPTPLDAYSPGVLPPGGSHNVTPPYGHPQNGYRAPFQGRAGV